MTADLAEALVWVAAGSLETQQLAVPDPGPGALLLRVEANGVCGTDLHLLSESPPYPTVLGHEIVGTIVSFGPGAKALDSASEQVAVGDRVALFPWIPCGSCWACHRFGPAAATCSNGFVYGIPFELTGAGDQSRHSSRADSYPWFTGGFGQYLYVYPGTYFWRVPEDMPTEIAALLDPLAVAVRTVDMARTATATWDEVLTADAVAVVQGAGPVGLLTAIALRQAGVGKILIVGAPPRPLKAARAVGADDVLDISGLGAAERLARVLSHTKGRGADLVVDCTNQPAALSEALSMVRRLGTVIEVGNMVNTGQTIDVDPAVDICQKNVRLLGMSANPPRSYTEAMALLSRFNHIPFNQIISHCFPQREAVQALGRLHDPDVVKVILCER